MRPEAAAVLAHAPTFLFKAARVPDGIKRLLRLACRLVFVGVEAREMTADDLAGQVALDPLRAEVPVCNPALFVEQIDGVVGDALDEQPELFLAFAERILRRRALGQVARNLGKSHKLAALQVNRIDDDVGPKLRAILTDTPALCLELAIPQRHLKCAPGKVRVPILLGVKARKVLPDDLVRDVTLEPLGARVPARHKPVGIEHKDRIIRNRLDKQAIASILCLG